MATSNTTQAFDFKLIRPQIEATADALLKQYASGHPYINYRRASALYRLPAIDVILQRLANNPEALKTLAASKIISLRLLREQGMLSTRAARVVENGLAWDDPLPAVMKKNVFLLREDEWIQVFRLPNFGDGCLAEIIAFMAVYKESKWLKSIDVSAEEKRSHAVDRFLAILAGPNGVHKAAKELRALKRVLREPGLKGNDNV